jgi:hypothetical protein
MFKMESNPCEGPRNANGAGVDEKEKYVKVRMANGKKNYTHNEYSTKKIGD